MNDITPRVPGSPGAGPPRAASGPAPPRRWTAPRPAREPGGEPGPRPEERSPGRDRRGAVSERPRQPVVKPRVAAKAARRPPDKA